MIFLSYFNKSNFIAFLHNFFDHTFVMLEIYMLESVNFKVSLPFYNDALFLQNNSFLHRRFLQHEQMGPAGMADNTD